MVLNIGINQAQNNTSINISFADAAQGTVNPGQAAQAANPAQATPMQGQGIAQPQQTMPQGLNPAMAQQQPRFSPVMSAQKPRFSPVENKSKGTKTSDLKEGGAGSQSKISSAIQNLTGHKRGQKAEGSRLEQGNDILDQVMSDPRWKKAETKKRGEQNAKSDDAANNWDILSNTAFHSIFNAEVLGTTAMSGDINAIQDPAEKALMTILKEVGKGDPETEKLLLAALHFKTTGVDLSHKIANGESKDKKSVPSDDILKDKPKRSEATKKSSTQSMDAMGFATFVGWNHDFSDGKVDGKLNRPTLDKEVIFKGADPMGHMGETLKALKSIDKSATMADAYDLSYHDIVGNLLGGSPEKLDTKKLVTTRLEKLGQDAGGEKEQGVKKHIKGMINKVGDVMKKNPEFASAAAGVMAGGAASMATGCPFAGMTAGMGAAMATQMKLKSGDDAKAA